MTVIAIHFVRRFKTPLLFLAAVMAVALPLCAAEILTPPAPATPRINGPKVFGVRPGSPFLFTIPATGVRPMKFSADHLPRGLNLDAKTGQITGKLKKPSEFNVTLRAKNQPGVAEKKFRIVCGDTIALTPPMGWNSWNCWAGAGDQDKVLRAPQTGCRGCGPMRLPSSPCPADTTAICHESHQSAASGW
jgi:alpha-galactosidase